MSTHENYNEKNRLQELGGSDFKIAEGEPDIFGWAVKDSQDRTIGFVDDLIIDPQSRKVRYIVLDLEGSALDLEARDVLIPIGIAVLHESADDVVLPDVTEAQLKALPTYINEHLNREFETSIRNVFAGPEAASASNAGSNAPGLPDEFYNSEHYNEDRLHRNRRTPPTSAPASGHPNNPVINEDLQADKRKVERDNLDPDDPRNFNDTDEPNRK